MLEFARSHLFHHGRFYISACVGILAFVAAPVSVGAFRLIAAGDAFFLIYLLSSVLVLVGMSPAALRERAGIEDEGIILVILIELAVIGMSCFGILSVLNQRHGSAWGYLAISVVTAPLGWMALHTLAAFRYANLHYRETVKAEGRTSGGGLQFPGTDAPGVWEFFYFAFVIGMTAQTSDVVVVSTRLRRAVLGHAVVSFFFNTAIIAMAVNAVIVATS